MTPDVLAAGPGGVWGLAALFFLVALVYASVGFGGGSAYLALLTLAAVPLPAVAPVALVCNVIVVSGGSWQFVRAGHFDGPLLLPFLVPALPAAYLGGRHRLDVPDLAAWTAAALLVSAAVLLLRPAPRADDASGAGPVGLRRWGVGAAVGGAIGGLAGVIGIGGGIFLAPALHLLRWGTAKQIAAAASLFILANSLAGLAGGLAGQAGGMEPADVLVYAPLFVAVLAGGQVGSRLGAWRFSPVLVRRLTAGVVAVAAVNLLLG